MSVPAKKWLFVAGILESEKHRGANPALPVGGGVRVVCTDEPWTFAADVCPGERLFVVPRVKVPFPLPSGWWPWTVGAAEIHVAVSIWPEPLRRWGTREAKKYFEEKILPRIENAHNLPDWWWQQPQKWGISDN